MSSWCINFPRVWVAETRFGAAPWTTVQHEDTEVEAVYAATQAWMRIWPGMTPPSPSSITQLRGSETPS